MDEALVSVIVLAFNAQADIRQTLESVLAQTYQKIEVIIVDDGSMDDTSAIVEEFVRRDSRFRIFWQCNAGVGAARNAAILRSRGVYIAPLDADDLWHPDKLEKQVARMNQCGNDTGFVYCWSTQIDKKGEYMYNGYAPTVEGRLRRALLMRNFIANGSIPLFRSAALERVGLYLTRAEQGEAQGCEDWDLNLRVAEIFSVGVVPEYLVAYRQRDSSMTMRTESMAASFAVARGRARHRNRDLPSATFRWAGGYFHFHLAEKCLEWEHCLSCIRCLKEAVCANPVLLLKFGIYSTFVRSAFSIIMCSTLIHPGKSNRRSPETRGRDKLGYKTKRKRPFILNKLFRYIESAHWSAALKDKG